MYTIMTSSDNNERIEVINEIQRRSRWTAAEKLALVQRTFESGQSVSLVAVGANESVVTASQMQEAIKRIKRIKQLEAALGSKTLENEILKEAVDYGKSRNGIALSPLLPGDEQ